MSLDPTDWSDFRRVLHRLADACADHLEGAREHPWRPFSPESQQAVALGTAEAGVGLEAMAGEMIEHILPYGAGNTHPSFFGWVQGSGTAAGMLAELAAAAMNSNCGGRDHGAVYVERDVIRWCAECFGFPPEASGVLVTGTSQATVLALAAARLQALGTESRKQGLAGGPRLTLYASAGAHNAITKAAELVGLGSAAVRLVPVDEATGSMILEALAEMVAADRLAGALPFCVVGTAGSVDRGSFDPLAGIADFCAAEGLWSHIDGAFGAWARLADEPWSGLVNGIERADSLALDFHKWMFVQYDCGLLLMRDEKKHRAAFAARPAYLAVQGAGLGGGDPWYCDYGIDLSRSFRALKVWATLRAYGRAQLGAAVTSNCQLAALMGELVKASAKLELAAQVTANICCFSVTQEAAAGQTVSAVNTHIVQQLQVTGKVIFSTTHLAGRTTLRAAITNHRTTAADIHAALAEVEALLQTKQPPQSSRSPSPSVTNR